MTKNNILTLIIISAIIAGVLVFFGYGPFRNPVEPVSVTQIHNPPPSPAAEQGMVITYTDLGFSPNPLTIKVGDTVTFKNNSSEKFWPATDPHPIHSGYPESGPCDKSNNAFDPCEAIPPGGSWSFTFKSIGTWGYHDHMNPGMSGKVIVMQGQL